MSGRRLARLSAAVLVLVVGINTLSGGAKIAFFVLRNGAEASLTSARLGRAFGQLHSAWLLQPGESTGRVLAARALRLALANGLPVETLPDRSPAEILGTGRDAVAEAIDRNPGDAWAWFNLADLYRGHRAGRLRMARLRRSVERARARDDGEPPGNRAKVEPQPHDPIIVGAALKALELDPEYYFYRDFLARLFWDAGLQEEAAREVERAFALLPDPASHVLIHQGGLPPALVEPALRGIEHAESHPLIDPRAVVLARAEFLLDQGRLDDSIAALERVRDSGTVQGLLELDLGIGQLHQRAGEDELAVPFLEGVLAADPDGDLGTRSLYSLGESYQRLGRQERAVEAFREHLVRRPQVSRSYLALAEAYTLKGSTAEAESLYRNALQRFPSDARVHLRWIRFLERDGRLFDALRAAEDAVQATNAEDARRALERLQQRALGGGD